MSDAAFSLHMLAVCKRSLDPEVEKSQLRPVLPLDLWYGTGIQDESVRFLSTVGVKASQVR